MPAPRLCFAYGSNLDSSDLDRWLTAHGASNPLTHPVAGALLPDHRYAYHYFSGSRGGGVLDVVRQPGHAVAGMLFEVMDEGWATLDRKEGVPFAYERGAHTAVLADGGFAQVLTYQVLPSRRDPSGHVPPTDAYHDAVRRGIERHGLRGIEALEAARQGKKPDSIVPHVFVYGTLRRGEKRAPHLQGKGVPTRVVAASMRGKLFAIQGEDYPALQLGAGGANPVLGELCTTDDIGALIERLDPVEGFQGYGHFGNLYERTLVTVQAESSDGPQPILAWTYVMADAHQRGTYIESGDWCRRD